MEEDYKRVVVVTGGSRGIGRAICRSFSDPHTDIYFTYNSDTKFAGNSAKFIADGGSNVVYDKLDISVYDDVMKFFSFVLKRSKRIDVLINNAGIKIDSLLVRMSEKSWDRVIDVNLKGAFNCIKAVSKAMIRQKCGRIISLSSIVGISGNPGQSNYAASKSGLIGLTKSAARELALKNVTVNLVAPGYVITSMTKNSKTLSVNILKQIPLGRLGLPKDVANLVYFLASENASYITGQVINVNGGLYM